MIKFTGFAPDIDPTTPGVITDCDNTIPSVKGMLAAPSGMSVGLPALAAACLGAVVVQKLDGTKRVFAGTDTKLYEGTGGSSWSDVSRVGDYTSGVVRWRFAQFGDDTIACNKADTLQRSTGAAFADISGAPKARFLDATQGFVMLGDTTDGTYGDSPDRWWCCAYQDVTSWTPSTTTQATTGRLIDSPGPLRAMKALGANFVAYKDRAMWIMQYVGAPDVWRATQIPGEIGCASNEAIVSIDTAHVFVGYEDFYLFDGSRPVPIGDGIKEWFFANLNKSYRYQIAGMHDRTNSRVWFFFPSISSQSGALDKAVVYHYKTGKWGKVSANIEVPIEYLTGQVTWDQLGTLYSTLDDLPAIAYDSPFWSSTSPVPAYIDTTHTLLSLTGDSSGMSLTTGDFGDDGVYTLMDRTRLRMITSPDSATMTNYYKAVEGASLTTDQTVSMSDGKFDVLRSARWHRVKYDFVGDCEVVGHKPQLTPDGEE